METRKETSTRVAYFDIESTGLDAEYGQLLCGVIGEHLTENPTEPRLHTFELEDFSGRRWEDLSLAVALRDELEKYDLAISYNGANFDVPFINTRLAEAGERGMVLRRHKDLLYTCRGKLRLGSNRLARVTQFLFGETQKTSITPGVWRRAICGRRKDYEYIIKHCQLDVIELAKVWDRLKTVAGDLR